MPVKEKHSNTSSLYSSSSTTNTSSLHVTNTLPRIASESSVHSFGSEVPGNGVIGGTGGLKDSIEYHLHEPISAGFLLKYCEAHYCSENMRFITEVDRFKDHFHRDRSAWPLTPWKQLDIDLGIIAPEQVDVNIDEEFIRPLKEKDFISEESWPSKVVNREAIRESLASIWDTFLAKDAKYWICIPYSALINTIKRIKYIHIYGHEVFSEALLDPVKTIQRDIYPRFIHSEEFKQMKVCQVSIDPLPCSTKLKLPKPHPIIFSRYDIRELERGNVSFTLNDLIEDRYLYIEFAKYLEQVVSAENLYCVRAIAIFKEAISSNDVRERTNSFELAWTVYKFFVAPGSAYEISIAYRLKKDLMRILANPTYNTFDDIEMSAMSALRIHFNNYLLTKEYARLHKIVLQNRNNASSHNLTGNNNNAAVASSMLMSSGGGGGDHLYGNKSSGGGSNDNNSSNKSTLIPIKQPRLRVSCFPKLA